MADSLDLGSAKQEAADKGGQSSKQAEQRKAIEALFLEDWEEEYLQALHDFIPTPRLVKRFVNVYRLLRVSATEGDFQRFVGNKRGGNYRAVVVLLAINIGYPTIGGQLLKLLCSRPAQGTWGDFMRQIDPDTLEQDREEWARRIYWSSEQTREFHTLKRHLEVLAKTLGITESLEAYVRWSREVGRYSFQWYIAADGTEVKGKEIVGV